MVWSLLDPRKVFSFLKKNILDLLNETGLLGCKAIETPIKPNLKLQPASPIKVIDKEKYQRLVGRLIYLSHTRPNIAFAVSMVSQFMHSPNQGHFDVVYRILRYLKGTPGKDFSMRTKDISKWMYLLMQIGQEV